MLKTAIRGKENILFPILLQTMNGVMNLAILMALSAALLSFAQTWTSISSVSAQSIWLWTAFLSLPAAAFWIFSAACRVRWWHGFKAAQNLTTNRPWIQDLPPVLVIDIITGTLRSLWSLTLFLSTLGIIANNSSLGCFLAALSGLLMLCLNIIEPAWITERILSGKPLLTALTQTLIKLADQPIKALATYLVPGTLTCALACAAALLAYAENGFGMMLTMAAAILLPCFVPVFWLHLMKNHPACDKPQDEV